MSAADITKYACILYFKWILRNNYLHIIKIINLVHDEILVEAPENLVEEAKINLIDCMEKAGKPFCPIIPLKATAEVNKFWVH